jgi:hypothetical protein
MVVTDGTMQVRTMGSPATTVAMPVADEMVCFSLYSVARAATRAYSQLLAPWDLTYTQYLVLVIPWTEGDVTLRLLGELLQLGSGTLSPLLRWLEEKSLIERRDQGDQRVVTVLPHLGRLNCARSPATCRRRLPAAPVCPPMRRPANSSTPCIASPQA